MGRTQNSLGKNKYFDLRMGIAGALILGTVVFIINFDHGYLPALTAALKQSAYTFLMGGLIMKLCENLAIRFENRTTSLVLAVLVPVIVTTGATFIVHSLKGTPEPAASTIPTIIFGAPSFAVWAVRKRNKVENPGS